MSLTLLQYHYYNRAVKRILTMQGNTVKYRTRHAPKKRCPLQYDKGKIHTPKGEKNIFPHAQKQ